MKKQFILFTLFFIFLISLAATFQVENTFPLFGRLIILDPGHGYLDPGATYQGELEKDYNLAFAQTLKNTLEELGASVMLTREGDYDLSVPNTSMRKKSDFNNRIKFIDDNNPDLYVSLHMNSIKNQKYYGPQVFYSTTNLNNEIIASILQEKLNRYLNLDKEYRKIGSDKYMFDKINSQGVLIEYGFLSSYKDRANLKDEKYTNELSSVIANGIVEYFT